MNKIVRVFLAVVATVGGVGIGAGTSTSASSGHAEEKDQAGQRSSSGSAAGGTIEKSTIGIAEECSDRRSPGACTSMKRAFTVERVDAAGIRDTGTGGAAGGGTGGAINDSPAEPQDRAPDGAIEDTTVDRGEGVTGTDQ